MNNPPAFPLAMPDQYHPEGAPLQQGFVESGMTLRDYFAAAALQSVISRYEVLTSTEQLPAPVIPSAAAEMSYRYADAMLAERDKGTK